MFYTGRIQNAMQTLLAILCIRTHAWSVPVACSNALRAPLMLSALGIQRDVVSCFQFWNFSELYYSHFAAPSCCVLRVIYHDRLHTVARFAHQDGVAIAGCVFTGFTDSILFLISFPLPPSGPNTLVVWILLQSKG